MDLRRPIHPAHPNGGREWGEGGSRRDTDGLPRESLPICIRTM